MKKNWLWVLPLTLVGCPSSPPATVSPTTPPPSTLPAQANAFVYPSGRALERGTLTVHFKTASGTATGVQASVMGPSLGAGDSGTTSTLVFSPLAGGVYRVVASSPDLAVSQVENLAVAYNSTSGTVDLANKSQEITMTLVPGGMITGKVLGPSGPLWGARVRAGQAMALTNQDGSFSLAGVTPGQVSVSIGKTFFAGTTRTVELAAKQSRELGSIALSPAGASYYLYNPGDPIEGKTVRESFTHLLAELNAAGFSETANASSANVWILVNPSRSSLPEAKCQEAQAFVRAGGKLILCGEWGGYGASPDEANRLLSRFGIGLNADLVRSTSNLGRLEWIAVRDFNFPRVRTVDEIGLLAACSTYGVSPAFTIASAGASGYRVMSGGIAVASAVQDGDGLVIAVGDSSAWADFNSVSSANYNLQQQNNLNFMLNLFQW